MTGHTQRLAEFVADLRFATIPEPVIRRAEDLLLDWLGSALAGKGMHPTPVFEHYARLMGPAAGRCRVLVNGTTTTAHFAAMINGASSHLVEQDDVHNGSVFHPAAVVFPAALAAAQDIGASGRDLLLAAVAGYEAGIRVGEFLGRSHYRIFHTTATVGTLAAAVAVGKLLDFNREQFLNVLGSAGTQAAGLWEFLRDAADSKQLHTAKASADGLLAAYMTRDGLTGALNVLEGPQGVAAGMSDDADPTRLSDRLGERWALLETSFKFHASCRHTHPAADALLDVMQREKLTAGDITTVTARVHQGAIDVLGNVGIPQTVHQAKFSMGTVLGLIAVHGKAGLTEFECFSLKDPAVSTFAGKVTMQRDEEVDACYPQKWLGRVAVVTGSGKHLQGAVDSPKGDPDNTLSRPELEDKFLRLTGFSHAVDEAKARAMIEDVWTIAGRNTLEDIFDIGSMA